MPEFILQWSKHVECFFIVMARIFGLATTFPILKSSYVGIRWRVVFSFWIACLIYPIFVEVLFKEGTENFVFVLELIGNTLIGFCIGLFVTIFLTVFQVMVQLFSFQMGFGIGELFDPLFEDNAPLLAQFFILIGTLVFVWFGGLEMMLQTLFNSYELISVHDLMVNGDYFVKSMLSMFVNMFAVAIRMSLPIAGTLFVVTLCLGMVSRFSPQFNVLMLGFPIYSLCGFMFVLLLVPVFVSTVQVLIKEMLHHVQGWMLSFGGG